MHKITIKYTDFNDVDREEDFYFNITKAEAIEIQLSEEGGLSEAMKKIVKEKDVTKTVAIWKKIIMAAYGVKSADGKRFIKSDEVKNAFMENQAYSELFMMLAGNADKAVEFITNVIPKVPQKELDKIKEQAKQEVKSLGYDSGNKVAYPDKNKSNI
jgi:hypothetical protein